MEQGHQKSSAGNCIENWDRHYKGWQSLLSNQYSNNETYCEELLQAQHVWVTGQCETKLIVCKCKVTHMRRKHSKLPMWKDGLCVWYYHSGVGSWNKFHENTIPMFKRCQKKKQTTVPLGKKQNKADKADEVQNKTCICPNQISIQVKM